MLHESEASRIAARFALLDDAQRRAVYRKISAQGLGIRHFPIVTPAHGTGTSRIVSHAQLRQWFLWQLDPQDTAYHIAGALQLQGHVNVEAVRSTLSTLIERHESLRTVFRASAGGEVEQLVQAPSECELTVIDLSGRTAQAAQSEAQRIAYSPFDLQRGPLLRAGLSQLASDRHLLVIAMHHIICDAWSMQIFVNEFAAVYRERVCGVPAGLPKPSIRYADYAAWQRLWLEAGESERQLAYWREQLGGGHPVLQLPTDHPRRVDGRHSAASIQIDLPAPLVRDLRRFARDEGASAFMVLLAAFQALLHRYSGQPEIRVGVPIANRQRVETEHVVGLFVNTQVMRAAVPARMTLQQLLRQTRQAALDAQSHQELPFEQLVEALQPERSLSSPPLFQVMFNHVHADHRALHELPGLTLQPYDLPSRQAQFELCVDIIESADGQLRAIFKYAAELFRDATIEGMAASYVAILAAVVERPGQVVADIDLLSDRQRSQLLHWSVNAQRYADLETVHEGFERQVREQPQAAALVFGETMLSYAELNARANRLAHRLIALGVKPESKVGIAVERSLEMIVGLLGILKAGGVYVPLDPEYPPQRLAYMAEDSGVQWVLTQSALAQRVALPAGVLSLALDCREMSGEPAHDPCVAVHAENLAYIIYTSGSTGRPKGAAIRHRSLASCMHWMQCTYALTRADTVLHKAPLGFDVSAWEIFWPLNAGVKLVLAQPGDQRDPQRLIELIREQRITTLNFVPAMLQAFLAQPRIESQTQLRYVICGGEAMPPATQREALQRLRGASLQNLYGPTETTIHVTQWTCRDEGRNPVPIGRPIADTQAYVLDADLNQVPQGVAGELYIGGISLGRGYLHRGALTAERFIAHPFSAGGERLYRTGDRVRWDAQGQLEYLGRIDHQVKIRGLRIELGEIEAQLLAQPQVREAVVAAKEGAGGARLVAYVSPQAQQSLDTAVLREHLSRELPDYMVPSAIVVLASLPLNANGKVDRNALPEPEPAAARAYEPPQGEVEHALAEIWSEVLGVQRVGRNDNFFELGGHSLLALRLIPAMQRAQLGTEFSLKDLYARPSVAALANHDHASAVVRLNARTNGPPPLFVIHDGWGSVLDYARLARQLAGIGTVYGVPYRHGQHTQSPGTLLELAHSHAQTMLEHQPYGPYRLCGWSLGGALAPMIASLLEQSGATVQFVGAIDPYVPRSIPAAPPPLLDEVKEFLSILVPSAAHERLLRNTQVQARLNAVTADADSVLDLLAVVLSQVDRESLLEYDALDGRELVDMFFTSRALHRMARSPVNRVTVTVPVTAWWSLGRAEEDRRRYWDWLSTGTRREYTVNAGHLHIVRDATLFAAVSESLQSAASR